MSDPHLNKRLSQIVGLAYLFDVHGKKDVLRMAKLIKYYHTQLGVQGNVGDIEEQDLDFVRNKWRDILSE